MLLIPGWAGETNEEEAGYIASELKKDRNLFLKWRRELRKIGYKKVYQPTVASVKGWTLDLIGTL
jgi:hypothetical protein